MAITRCKPRAREHKTRNFIHVPSGESLAESFSSALDVHPIGCLRFRLAGLFKVLFPLTVFFRALVLSDKINCAIFLSSRAAHLPFVKNVKRKTVVKRGEKLSNFECEKVQLFCDYSSRNSRVAIKLRKNCRKIFGGCLVT